VHQISSDIDPDLALIVAHWQDLPNATKRNILHVVRSYAKTPDAQARREAVRDALRRAHADDRQADRMHEGGEP